MGFDFYQWYSKLTSENLFYSFKGTITGEAVTLMLEEIEREFENVNESSKIIRKLYNIIVEVLQNLFHHVEEVPEELKGEYEPRFALFSLIKTGDNFKICTVNFLKNEKIQFLKDRIDQINFLQKEELKALYKIILNNQEFSNKGGGGLGLIDISRRSGSKIEYSFHKITDTHSFYIMEVVV